MIYNTDLPLWQSYAAHLRRTALCGTASVVIYPSGDVSQGMRIIARFKSRREARKTLERAGFQISRQLGMGSCTRALNARVFSTR